MTDCHRDILPRRQFIEEFHISDSTERRKRTSGQAWPPHLRIGAKIYYRRAVIEVWIAEQEQLAHRGQDRA